MDQHFKKINPEIIEELLSNYDSLNLEQKLFYDDALNRTPSTATVQRMSPSIHIFPPLSNKLVREYLYMQKCGTNMDSRIPCMQLHNLFSISCLLVWLYVGYVLISMNKGWIIDPDCKVFFFGF